MAKLKKSEAFTVEREREIQQASEDLSTTSFYSHLSLICFFLKESVSISKGCRICKWACSDYEGSVGTCYRPGSKMSFLYQLFIQSLKLVVIRLSNWIDFPVQGTIVDRIDYNIQNVASTVEEGLKQLQKVHFPSINMTLTVLKFFYGLFLYKHNIPICLWIWLTGWENTEERRDGEVCYSAHYHVLYHVGPPNPQRDILVICINSFLHHFAYILIVGTFPWCFHTRKDRWFC